MSRTAAILTRWQHLLPRSRNWQRIQLREGSGCAHPRRTAEQLNHNLCADILPGALRRSYADPAYAVRMLGAELGPLLSAFYAQFRAAIVFAYGRLQADRYCDSV
ncbi:MAG: hypothetical protein ACLUD2_14125 [Clostridium sp.]